MSLLDLDRKANLNRFRSTDDVPTSAEPGASCSAEGCTRPVKTAGCLCKPCYQKSWRLKKLGRPASTAKKTAKAVEEKASAPNAKHSGFPGVADLPAAYLAECVREARRRASEAKVLTDALCEVA